MKWTEIVTAIVAVFALALSAYNSIQQSRHNKPKVKVKISEGFIVCGNGKTSEVMVFLSASNMGQMSITLSSQSFRLPNKKYLAVPMPLSNVKFPYELLPRKACKIWLEARELANGIKSSGLSGKIKIIGIYTDQTDISYKSKPFKFDADEWNKN
jgi:hypothetical protein